MMMLPLWALLVVGSLPGTGTQAPPVASNQVCLMVPQDVEDCYRSFQGKPISDKAAQVTCLQRLLWNFLPDDNLTSQDTDYLRQLLNTSRISGGGAFPNHPPSGYRVRHEYRTLSEADRRRFHDALNRLYRDGVIRIFARLHASAAPLHYGGPSFLPWHRVFLAVFEEALRSVDPSVTLPYWDSTMDDDMDNPCNSVLWSPAYLGNGAGDVVTGPFSGWVTDQGNLERRYGRDSRLLSLEMIRDVLTRCNLREISKPTAQSRYDLEFLQWGVNNWVGGDMSSPNTAGFDPVFYMHHAFVDYIWELFRRRQYGVCGIDPVGNYPSVATGDSHHIDAPMVGFDLTVREGLQQFWMDNWYRYESTPTCPNCCPNCPQPEPVYCERQSRVCLARSRRTFPFDMRTATSGSSGGPTQYLEPEEIASLQRSTPPRNRAVSYSGPRNDGRTLATAVEDAIRRGRTGSSPPPSLPVAGSSARAAGFPRPLPPSLPGETSGRRPFPPQPAVPARGSRAGMRFT